jgi:eukaryotic-like serine/threonine-protein kinase
MKSNLPENHPGQPLHHRIGTIFTLVFLSLLVGSLVVILSLMRHNTSHSQTASLSNVSSSSALSLYVADGAGGQEKLDARTGTLLWRFQTQARTISAPATVVAGSVFFGTIDGTFYALSATSGKENWHFSTGGAILGSPVVNGNVVYVGSDDGKLYALNASTGTMLWSYYAGRGNEAVSLGTATVVNGVVYSNASNNVNHSYLFALNAATGSALWNRQIDNQLISSPQVFNGKVYVTATTLAPPSTESHVYVFNAKDGLPPGLLTPHSQAAIANDVLLAPPTVAGGVVFYGSRNGNVNALKADSLASVWSRNVGGDVAATPVAYQQMLFVGMSTGTISANAIIALNALNGQLIWQHGLPNYSGANIVVNGGVLYVGTSTGGIYALNADNGSQQWVYQQSTPFSNTPIIVVAG